jgi:hypothetical protein
MGQVIIDRYNRTAVHFIIASKIKKFLIQTKSNSDNNKSDVDEITIKKES